MAQSASEQLPAPRVSVLMTIYNAMPYLAASIRSLLEQSFPGWELIAVENGSTDGSAAFLASCADPRIQVFALSENIGRTPALRYAFERAKGEYIAVLDADDVAHPDRLLKQVNYLDAHADVVLLGTWAEYIDGNDAVTGKWLPPAETGALRASFGYMNPIVHSSAMYRAADARIVGGYPLDTPFAQDLGLWLRLCERGGVAVLSECLSQFRILPQSMTRSGRYRMDVARDQLQLLLKARRQLALEGESDRRNREEIAIARMRYALALAKSRRIGQGALMACRTLIGAPLALINNRVTRNLFGR